MRTITDGDICNFIHQSVVNFRKIVRIFIDVKVSIPRAQALFHLYTCITWTKCLPFFVSGLRYQTLIWRFVKEGTIKPNTLKWVSENVTFVKTGNTMCQKHFCIASIMHSSPIAWVTTRIFWKRINWCFHDWWEQSFWFCFQSWADPALTWNPANYGGVSPLVIPAENIWKPEIAVFNRYKYDEIKSFWVTLNWIKYFYLNFTYF